MASPQHQVQAAHVVIVGAGFAGLEAAKALGRAGIDVTLVDRQNHHLFQPLRYQVATAALSAPDIAEPVRAILPPAGLRAWGRAAVRLPAARDRRAHWLFWQGPLG